LAGPLLRAVVGMLGSLHRLGQENQHRDSYDLSL